MPGDEISQWSENIPAAFHFEQLKRALLVLAIRMLLLDAQSMLFLFLNSSGCQFGNHCPTRVD